MPTEGDFKPPQAADSPAALPPSASSRIARHGITSGGLV
ncbi:hypothetical protein SS05631_a43630 (plasmid) [Sinorhizobium sp. CCBAU 05631]|nr:hypothetical protein SS05631_a43630 [Sinorhizobium sp. CCBAU 05631]